MFQLDQAEQIHERKIEYTHMAEEFPQTVKYNRLLKWKVHKREKKRERGGYEKMAKEAEETQGPRMDPSTRDCLYSFMKTFKS